MSAPGAKYKDWKREAKIHPCIYMFQHFEFAQFRLLLTAKDFAATSVARIIDPRVCLQVMVLRSDFCKAASSNDLVCGAILAFQEPFPLAYTSVSDFPKGSRRVGRGDARLSLSQHIAQITCLQA